MPLFSFAFFLPLFPRTHDYDARLWILLPIIMWIQTIKRRWKLVRPRSRIWGSCEWDNEITSQGYTIRDTRAHVSGDYHTYLSIRYSFFAYILADWLADLSKLCTNLVLVLSLVRLFSPPKPNQTERPLIERMWKVVFVNRHHVIVPMMTCRAVFISPHLCTKSYMHVVCSYAVSQAHEKLKSFIEKFIEKYSDSDMRQMNSIS